MFHFAFLRWPPFIAPDFQWFFLYRKRLIDILLSLNLYKKTICQPSFQADLKCWSRDTIPLFVLPLPMNGDGDSFYTFSHLDTCYLKSRHFTPPHTVPLKREKFGWGFFLRLATQGVEDE